MAARLANQFGHDLLGMTVGFDQLVIALGLFNRTQILALDILDQRDLGRGFIVELAHDRRDQVDLRLLRRAPPPLARNNLKVVANRSKQDRLQHPALGDRRRQLGHRLLIEMPPRLRWVGPNPPNLDIAHAVDRCATLAHRTHRFVDQRAESPAEATYLLHAASAARIGRRSSISRASLMYASDPGHFRS